MPKFNVTDDQINQIITVVSGMTNEKLLPNEARQLTPAEFAIERGRWAVKELNCEGCHQVESRGWAIRADGHPAGHGTADAQRSADAIAGGTAHAAGLAVRVPESAADR